MVWVRAAWKVSVLALVTLLVRLKKLLLPVMDWLPPVNITVPLPGAKVPPMLSQLPVRLMLLMPAEKVPLLSVKFPETVMALARVAVPPAPTSIFRLPRVAEGMFTVRSEEHTSELQSHHD